MNLTEYIKTLLEEYKNNKKETVKIENFINLKGVKTSGSR